MNEPTRVELERALAPLRRRTFLQWAALAAAAGVLPAGCEPQYGPPSGVVPRTFAPRTWEVFNRATRRIGGPPAAAAIDAGEANPAARADAWLAELGPVAEPFETALWTLEFGVWPLLGKLRPFSWLDGPEQDAVLRELMESRLALKRQLFGALKTFACLAWYADPAAHEAIGYPGPFGTSRVRIADAMTYTPGR